MTERDKSRTESSSDIADVARDIANNVKEVVEEIREDMKAVAQELGLAEPERPTDGERLPSPVAVANPDTLTPDDNRYNPHPVEMKWFERWESNPALYASDAA